MNSKQKLDKCVNGLPSAFAAPTDLHNGIIKAPAEIKPNYPATPINPDRSHLMHRPW